MKISYNWLKSYIPEVPDADKLVDIFNYHLCEMESLEKKPDGDIIFDLKILPNRAHDLLSHQGVAWELASLLNIKFVDPSPKHEIKKSKGTNLKIDIQTPKCRRHVGRIVRNVKVGPSPKWAVECLESIGQRSINNIVDATNIVMFDCGQPAHAFDMDKVKGLKLIIRQAKNGEKIIPLGGKEKILNETMMVIADGEGNLLDVAGIKGGTNAELTVSTTNLILESDNFDPVSIRKTAQALNLITDAKKRYENDLSPEIGLYAMQELSMLICGMCPEAIFEDIVDVYPTKQEVRKLSFSADKVSKILGLNVSNDEVKNILKRYNFPAKGGSASGGEFEITVPPMRLDLVIEEDIAEEIGRILGYDKVKPKIPKINFEPKLNEIYSKILFTRNKLLNDGYSEVMNSTFRNSGEVSVLASASDKKFLRTNLTDGLKESMKLNKINALLLGLSGVKIFEIGTIFKKSGEEMHVAYNEGNKIIEKNLDEFLPPPRPSGTPPQAGGKEFPPHLDKEGAGGGNLKFKMWSLFPFIARDIAVWVPGEIKSDQVAKIIKENTGDMVVRGPELFDEFKKENQVSYAFRLIFQSYERTLTDAEVNDVMNKITEKIKENKNWQVR
jgi:phenylalanyl-tRNA synthetase beta chain